MGPRRTETRRAGATHDEPAAASGTGSFVFATCAVGYERFLRAEVVSRAPAWRLAFSRPGLVTWKAPSGASALPPVAFARVLGASIGRAESPELAPPLVAAALAGETARLHVFARDPAAEGAATAVRAYDAVLRDALPAAFHAETRAAPGDLVLDVVVHPGEPALLGAHRQDARAWPEPGGLPAVVPPDDAPSRAYAKIEEAIARGGLDVRAGERALEIGSAPGGAALALVRRGLHVVGVDPGEMDPRALSARGPGGARLDHRRIPVGGLRYEDLEGRIDWLLLDVNLAPQVALHATRRLMPRLRGDLRGAVLTLKMNDLAFVAELPALERRILELGFREVRTAHLPANRKEVCAIAR